MKNALFRFLFIYFLLSSALWIWLGDIPGISYLIDWYSRMDKWMVTLLNDHVFHVREVLVPQAGSGDTSFGWAQFFSYLLLAVLGMAIWTAVDYKRSKPYKQLEWLLRNYLRYYVALVAFMYGIIKLFAMQMVFPNLSQLATPLGDFLPMRFSWMFIGYSTPYQVFSGVMETLVAILLLYRPTATTGALLGVGVFANVFLLNLSYDIPVKLFSGQLLLCCLFLALSDWRRILQFLVLNQEAPPSELYRWQPKKRWQQIGRVAFKIGFILLFVGIPTHRTMGYRDQYRARVETKPIKTGVYGVRSMVTNGDTLHLASYDEYAWKDFVFDVGGRGSVHTVDTLFRQRYHRGYFQYEVGESQKTISFKRQRGDEDPLFEMSFTQAGTDTLYLDGVIRNDSVKILLVRDDRHFQLTERPFNWVTEAIK